MTQGRARGLWWLAVPALVIVVGGTAVVLRHGRDGGPESPPFLSPDEARCAWTYGREPRTPYRVRITHGVRPRLRAVDIARRARRDLGPLVSLDRVTASTTSWLPSVEPGVGSPGDTLDSIMWVARGHGCIGFDRAPRDVVFSRGYVVYDRTGNAVADGTG